MTGAPISDLVAGVVALCVVLGAALTLIGAIGLLRMRSFFVRLHPPTMGTTLGTALVLIGSMVLFSALESRPVFHEVLIGIFMTVTTPVTFMLLARAARYRASLEREDSSAVDGKAPSRPKPPAR